MDLTEDEFDNTSGNEDVRTHRLDLVGHGFDENAYWLDANATVKTPLIDVLSHRKAADANFQFRIHDIDAVLGDAIAGQSHIIPSSTTTSYTATSITPLTAVVTRVNNTTLTVTVSRRRFINII